MFGRNELIKLLLKHGANINLKDYRGMSALDLAAQQGNEEGVLLLQQHKINPSL
ncbi:ankyrin repeat protein [Pedobacter sp. UYP1]